jgi:hypothetical protein
MRAGRRNCARGWPLRKPGTAQELDYGMIGEDGTLEAEPGLWLDVVRIASAQADLALNELLRDTNVYKAMPANTVIQANSALEIVSGEISPPYAAVWVNIVRDPECLVCGESLRSRDRLAGEQGDASLSLQDLADNSGIALEEETEEE